MIIVTGASGQLGRLVIEKLLDRVEPDQIGASVRDPNAVAELASRGVRVRRGDFGDAASLAHAFEDASRVLVVSANAVGDVAKRLNATAIDAASKAGAHRVFYTSHVGVNEESAFPPMPVHHATEAFGRNLGAPFTALRNGFYAEFAPNLLGDAVESGELKAPADGPMSWTTHPDLAEATAAILVDDNVDDDVIDLTASEAVDLAEIAALAADITGRSIARIVVADDQYRAQLSARGLPDAAIEMSMGIFAAAHAGQFATVDPTLAQLLGRPPTSIKTILTNALEVNR